MMAVYVLVFLVALMGYFLMFPPEANKTVLGINESSAVAMAITNQHEAALKTLETHPIYKTILERPATSACPCPQLYYSPFSGPQVFWWSAGCDRLADIYTISIPLNSTQIHTLLGRDPVTTTMPGIITSTVSCTKNNGQVVLSTWMNPDRLPKTNPGMVTKALMSLGDYGVGDGTLRLQNDFYIIASNNQYSSASGTTSNPMPPFVLAPSSALPIGSQFPPEGAPIRATLVKTYQP
ncbi:MAG TPA: hypothetical protein DCW68_07070 [Rhodospirillaceae bacterium]|nr:MAG: hypothetical protein A2018_06580 [Alphaproteobacteria bacterium GWF2_58_20]HAU29849.1 hypothetical protein [Rhodospirillaceae bacterium]